MSVLVLHQWQEGQRDSKEEKKVQPKPPIPHMLNVQQQKRRLYIYNFLKLYVLKHRREEDPQTPCTIHVKGVTTTPKFGSKREDYLQPYQSLVGKRGDYIYIFIYYHETLCI